MENYFSSKDKKLGILGGGQLGKMLLDITRRYDLYTKVLDPSADAPCATGCKEFVQGNFNDYDTVMAFGADCDVLTIEIESVNTQALKELQSRGKHVFPQPEIVELIQNKVLQKQFYADNQLPTAPWFGFKNKAEMKKKMEKHSFHLPFVWKAATGGYDGRGVMVIRNMADLEKIPDIPGLIEELAAIQHEIALVAARNQAGRVAAFPPVEMSFHPVANQVEYVFCPAKLSETKLEEASQLALSLVDKLGIVGVLAVEMFVNQNGEIWINECAPRVHNSGHLTIEACITSQFEQHLRAILGFPLGSTQLIRPAVMVNLTGEEGFTGPVFYEGAEKMLATEGAYMHLYGKTETRPFRKMGHVTLTAETLEEAREKALKVKEILKVKSV
ncbi:MAG: 5-(carboxyamino)imidazole ribonucleotide synthase [Bacteroidetes bacterium]|nr:MAG: 5-(carboxyamino)imidazole ribonucleotide synthase [Bacteroidota bacterium]